MTLNLSILSALTPDLNVLTLELKSLVSQGHESVRDCVAGPRQIYKYSEIELWNPH